MKKHAVALLTALCVAAGCTASADTAKHERVYVVVNHDGEVQTLLDNCLLYTSFRTHRKIFPHGRFFRLYSLNPRGLLK